MFEFDMTAELAPMLYIMLGMLFVSAVGIYGARDKHVNSVASGTTSLSEMESSEVHHDGSMPEAA